MIKIIIVDDHKLFRMALRMALSECQDFCVSGDVESGADLFTMLETTSCDLVLLDLNLPDMNGVEIARCLRRKRPDIKILVISCENDDETIHSLIALNVEGFISKQAGKVNEIIHAMSSIMDGCEYFGDDILNIMYQIYISKTGTTEVLPELSAREKEIITLCGNGLLAKEIANQLNISVSTVQNHKYNIFRKLNINNTMEMVQYALRCKIIRM
jgi:DNA-binding NarL/FixJ family response regulator